MNLALHYNCRSLETFIACTHIKTLEKSPVQTHRDSSQPKKGRKKKRPEYICFISSATSRYWHSRGDGSFSDRCAEGVFARISAQPGSA